MKRAELAGLTRLVTRRRRSTQAEIMTRVSGMPKRAKKMQKSLPAGDRGEMWP